MAREGSQLHAVIMSYRARPARDKRAPRRAGRRLFASLGRPAGRVATARRAVLDNHPAPGAVDGAVRAGGTYSRDVTTEANSARIAVVIPAFGLDHLTHALLGDVFTERDLVDAFIVDNGGDYVRLGDEFVLRPGTNLGWLRGSNFGLEEARTRGPYAGYVLLNNDTRLSPNFFAGLVQAASRDRVGVVGPLYDDWWPHQLGRYRGAAAAYVPTKRLRKVPFVDGTCIYLTSAALERIGNLDADSFAETGWGADFDYAYRVRLGGFVVLVTGASYLNHIRGATANAVYGDYHAAGVRDLATLEQKWGPEWRRLTGLQPSGLRYQATRVRRALVRRVRGILGTPRIRGTRR